MGYRISRLGWLRDPPDYRDEHLRDPRIAARLNGVVPHTSRGVARTGGMATAAGKLVVDLRPWCSPIEDQGHIGSCTAQAVVGALEYFERKTRGEHVDASRRFLYRATRRYLGWEGRGDTGAFVRSTIKALALFGAVPEEYWPYDELRYDDEPTAFHYAFAQNFKALEYYRVPENPADLKQLLQAGIPFIFGFTCFSSTFEAETKRTGVIPFPSHVDSQVGGHAVLAVGYTDSHILIRNSWGVEWGDQGYGYLPFCYFDGARPLATDCWVLVNASWVSDDAGTVPALEAKGPASTAAALRALPPKARMRSAERTKRSSPCRGLREDEKRLVPRVLVTRGTDPLRALPLRFGAGALKPDGAVPMALVASRPASLYLKSIKLLESFDWALFGNATNELYVTGIVWDLSGRAPLVLPPEPTNPDALKAYRMRVGDTVTLLGDGFQLWPQQPIVGGLYLRLVLMESDADVREVGKRLEEVHEALRTSDLPAALGALAAGVAAPALSAVAVAAELVTGVMSRILQANGDDLVGLFEGTYGAEDVTDSRLDRYTQGGAEIELDFTVATTAAGAATGKPSIRH